ncbi:hypothetical protein EV182_002117 [Spiromyces aspiralis]|uniref:Uncharacterized protein n=1 Tax=Spiromyces aspiralis TaxID=68401 RepID=A0ACC1HZT2_9FUNG|nr:hypothetical protein EV182_002117 [Spiromyces aspiralis]
MLRIPVFARFLNNGNKAALTRPQQRLATLTTSQQGAFRTTMPAAAASTPIRSYTKVGEYTAPDYLSPEEFERFLAEKNNELREFLAEEDEISREFWSSGGGHTASSLDTNMYDALAKDFARQCQDHHHVE